MRKNINLIAALSLGALVFTSCADNDMIDLTDFEKPHTLAEYLYLNDYGPLKSYVDRTKYPNFHLGVGTTVSNYNSFDVQYRLTNANFDETVAGNAMKMASCVSDDGTMDFATVSEYVNNATDAGLSVYGHTLAWHSQQPVKWLNSLLEDRPVEIDPDAMVETVVHECDYANYTDYPWYRMTEAPYVSDGMLIIPNSEEGLADWQLQYFVDDGVPTVAGEDYIIRTTIKGSKAGALNCNVGDWGGSASTPIGFTDEWQTVDYTVSGVPSDGAFVIFQSGSFVGTIWIKKVQVIKKESAGPVKYWASLIDNGDMEGDDAKNFASKENAGDIVYKITDGVGRDGSRGVKINSNGGQPDSWESQFWIVSNEVINSGDKIHVQFDYRADGGAVGTNVDTQAHYYPGEYQHWSMIGSPSFTADWQTYENTVTVSSDQAPDGKGMLSIAFNMSPNATDGTYYIDNVVLEVEKSSASGGIPLTDEEKHDTLVWAMDRWISGMMEACDGKVKAWDVVNESVSGGNPDSEGVYALQHWADSQNDTEFFWQDYLGDLDYVRQAVRLARQYGPSDIKLFVNDYNLESDWDSNGKLKSLIKWIERWESDGVTKIDGIGTQMHISCYVDASVQESKKNAIVNAFKLMAQTGKLVRISELDMDIIGADGNSIPTADVTEEQHHLMADLYKFVIQQYLSIIPASQQWGICQWAPLDSPAGSGWRADRPIGLWDLNYSRKHTYAGFADGLSGK